MGIEFVFLDDDSFPPATLNFSFCAGLVQLEADLNVVFLAGPDRHLLEATAFPGPVLFLCLCTVRDGEGGHEAGEFGFEAAVAVADGGVGTEPLGGGRVEDACEFDRLDHVPVERPVFGREGVAGGVVEDEAVVGLEGVVCGEFVVG